MSLVGRIECRLDLGPESSDFTKKRKFRDTSGFPKPSNAAGMFFVPSVSNNTAEYLVVVPESKLKLICDAARSKSEIRLTKFKIIESLSDFSLLEVEEIDWAVQNEKLSNSMWENALSLKELKCKEASPDYSESAVVVRVDAISPIIAVVPSDPFCFVEVGEDAVEDCQKTCNSCIIVIKGKSALACHGGILPGDLLLLKDFRIQKWTLPDSLNTKGYIHLPVPNRVLVITKPCSIAWKSGKKTKYAAPLCLPTIQGSVVGVRYTEEGIIQTLLLKVRGSIIGIMMTHLPISINLYYGLRKGAFVQALNLHDLTFRTDTCSRMFGACLRSSVIILRPASAAIKNECIPLKNMNKSRPKPIPWRYSRLRRSYFHQALLDHIETVKFPVSYSGVAFAQQVCYSLMDLIRRYSHNSALKKLVEVDDNLAANRKRRDQFAEFLEHGAEFSDCSFPKVGCHLNKTIPEALVALPKLMTLSDVRTTMLSLVKEKIIEWLDNGGKIFQGAVCSFQFNREDIDKHAAISPHCKDEPLHIVGNPSRFDKFSRAFFLGDDFCLLPATAKKEIKMSSEGSDSLFVCSSKYFIASSICLGKKDINESSEINLPPWTQIESSRNGSCALMNKGGYLFLASLHIHCENIVGIDKSSTIVDGEKHRIPYNVQRVLSLPIPIHERAFFSGILCHQRLKVARIREGRIQGYRLALCHCTPDLIPPVMESSELSPLQSLDIDASISVPPIKKAHMVKCIEHFSTRACKAFMDDELHLALSCWGLADSTASAVAAGGYDEIRKTINESSKSNIQRLIPFLLVPVSSMAAGSNGFIRFKCDVDDLSVSLVEVTDIPAAHIDDSASLISAISIGKHFQGTLCRTLVRRGGPYGELHCNQGFRGIQDTTLGMLNEKLCADIRTLSQTNLAPCLVRIIRGATLLTVSYCKVQVECTRCFTPYVKRLNCESCPCSTTENLRWNKKDPENNVSSTGKSFHDMQCPNLCPSDFGEVKWECSGILDDGTGQGKLYSERQATLLMLGMSQSTQTLIEEGACHTDTGIIYQKAMPPSSYLQKSLKELQRFPSHGEMTENGILKLLAPTTRASYLLYRHFSNLHATTRDYLVRCKPISSDIYLNQTYVEKSIPALKATQQAVQNEASSYSLPPLKLSLVDCVMWPGSDRLGNNFKLQKNCKQTMQC